MGYAIAEAAHQRGYDVVLISGPVCLPPPEVQVIHVTSAQQMHDEAIRQFASCDAAVMAAAVSDWRPVVCHARKPAKDEMSPTIEMEPTPDICAALGRQKGKRIVIGFALQDQNAQAKAEEKMHRKQCDAIVMNRLEAMEDSSSTIEIKVEGEPWRDPVTLDKKQSGQAIVDLVEELAARRS